MYSQAGDTHLGGFLSSSYLFSRLRLSLATMQTMMSVAPWSPGHRTPGAPGHAPGLRGVVTDLGLISFDCQHVET